MGKKQFKRAIKDKDYDKDDMEMALEIWRNNSNLKRNYTLNDFVDKPQDFIEEILDNEELKLETKIKNIKKEIDNLITKDFLIIFEDDKKVLLGVGNWRTNHYLAVNYLRQKNDGEKFGSGPTWCIADDENGKDMWEHYGLEDGEYPNTYMLLSKKDSFIRYQITFNAEPLENYIDNNGSYFEEEYNDETEEWEEVEKEYNINEVFNEVRNINQKLTETSGVYDDIKSKLGISKEDILEIITNHKNQLRGFKNNPKNDYYQLREEINSLDEELDEITNEYETNICKDLVEKLSITKENYILNECEYPLDKIKEIYIKNKRIDLTYLNYLFDFFYSERLKEKNKKAENIFKKYDFKIKDYSKMLNYANGEIGYLKNRFLSVFLNLFYKTNPINSSALKNENCFFHIDSDVEFFSVIDDIIENDIQKCVSGVIYDIIIIDSDEDLIELMEKSLRWRISVMAHNGRIFNKEVVDEMVFCKDWIENKNIPVSYYVRLAMAIFSQKSKSSYDYEKYFKKDDFFESILENPQKYLELMKLDLNVSKKISEIVRNKIMNGEAKNNPNLEYVVQFFSMEKLFSDKEKEELKSKIKEN